jgi:hypothetical protein
MAPSPIKIKWFNTFRLAFSVSSLFWYIYIIIISPFHLSTHYYGQGNVTSYFREQSFDFYGGGGHGIFFLNNNSLIKRLITNRGIWEAWIFRWKTVWQPQSVAPGFQHLPEKNNTQKPDWVKHKYKYDNRKCETAIKN